jgi:hypothetical protein
MARKPHIRSLSDSRMQEIAAAVETLAAGSGRVVGSSRDIKMALATQGIQIDLDTLHYRLRRFRQLNPQLVVLKHGPYVLKEDNERQNIDVGNPEPTHFEPPRNYRGTT